MHAADWPSMVEMSIPTYGRSLHCLGYSQWTGIYSPGRYAYRSIGSDHHGIDDKFATECRQRPMSLLLRTFNYQQASKLGKGIKAGLLLLF